MSTVAIIQCRMTSERYPGKILAPFLGKPVLAHVVDRIKLTKTNPKIILATSEKKSDDPLVYYAKHLGIEVVRGSLNDVISRFVLTLKKFKCESFFRVCGDSPLLIPSLFDKALSIYDGANYDLVTNVFPRTFPKGMSVELIKTNIFLETEKKIKNTNDREHVTQYFYDKSKKFKIYNIECGKSLAPNLNLALDKIEDLKKLEEWDQSRIEEYDKIFPIGREK